MEINCTIFSGFITRRPETKYLPSGTAIAKLVVAISRKYKDGDEQKEEVSFIQATAFGKTAERCGEYLDKGSRVMIRGRLRQERWKDKETEQSREKIQVVVEEIIFVGKWRKKEGETEIEGDPGRIIDDLNENPT